MLVNDTVTSSTPGSSNVAMPGPDSCDQLNVKGATSPSSVTVASTTAGIGNTTLRSGPASTTAGMLPGSTVTDTLSNAERAPSHTVSRSLYKPATGSVAVVSSAAASANTATPGPASCDQAKVSGNSWPSSVDVPSSTTLAGKVIVWSGPASVLGRPFGVPPFALALMVLNSAPVVVKRTASAPMYAPIADDSPSSEISRKPVVPALKLYVPRYNQAPLAPDPQCWSTMTVSTPP